MSRTVSARTRLWENVDVDQRSIRGRCATLAQWTRTGIAPPTETILHHAGVGEVVKAERTLSINPTNFPAPKAFANA